ncbi:6-hydroxymethylpterin diphosphokinase MptE-like protein [Methanobacterium aggregans]|uniref:6-hydroxymethylpterin diphosphokinase MptE-like protein n=1 Tax=Methanobacterium aggregans TaxID=1615586 RepID=UPI001AE5D94B|nr:6-hydroxymethylpterin diphosphokinase MptE-like protein [Methanobacterium aggregans]MBP2046513.1 putative Rossmann fold enzyme [Methanobacterium aggregans]
MNLDIWFQWYKCILEAFGFDKNMDERSAETLNKILDKQKCLKPNEIPVKRKVIIFGAGPSLKRNLKELKNQDLTDFTLISADGATTALREEDIIPDIIVTDLDGKIGDILHANSKGSVLLVHAHGNNLENIEKYVPVLKNVLGTTQSVPLEHVHDFGGFTDGDRCLFFAVERGAELIVLAGMDFGKIVTKYSRPDIASDEGAADEVKELKLKYAKELVEWAAENENIEIVTISGGEKVKGVLRVDFRDIN